MEIQCFHEVRYNPFTFINGPPATVSVKDLLSSLRFSFHMQSFAHVIFLLQPPQLCLLSLVYNEFAQVPISFFLVYVLPYVTMYSRREQCCHFHFVLYFSFSSVQWVRERANLVYWTFILRCGLITVTFLLSLDSNICNEAEKTPISLLQAFQSFYFVQFNSVYYL